MKEYTLKEIQETCDRLGARLRFMPTAEAKYLTGETTPRLWTAILKFRDTVVAAQGATMDEAYGAAVARVSLERA